MKGEHLHTNKNNGFSLVEILVALAIFLIFVTAILNLNVATDRQVKRAANSEGAINLAEEALEAVRNIRDDDFSNLTDGTFGLVSSSTEWALQGTSDENSIFTREIIINTIDANTKEVTSNVSWGDQISLGNSVSLKTYLTNWQSYVPPAGLSLQKVIINYFSNKVASDFVDYNATTQVGTTTVVNTFDINSVNETPAFTYTFDPLTLSPGIYTISETVDPNYVQTFSGDCAVDGTITLASLDSKLCIITNEEKYANLTVTKNVVNNGGTKTATDFAPYKYDTTTIIENTLTKVPPGTYTVSEAIDPDYTATFAGDCSVAGLITLNEGESKTCQITNTQATWANPNIIAGTLDASGTQDGRKVQVSGNYAYIVRAGGTPDFLIVNISDPTSPSLTGSLSLSGNPSNVFVSGNYAYVSSDDNAQELQIINVTNPASPTLAATFDAISNNNANTVFVSGNYAYLGRANTGIEQDFIVVNVTNPASPILVTSLNTVASSYEIVVSGNYAYIASGDNAAELKVVDITNPATPTVLGGYNASSNTDGITVAVSGNVALIGQGSNLHKINITTPSTPTLLGTYAAGGIINDISIWDSASYAFLATANTTAEMAAINISPATPTLIGNFNASATFNGTAYDVARNRAVMVGTADTAELTIIKP